LLRDIATKKTGFAELEGKEGGKVGAERISEARLISVVGSDSSDVSGKK
jgi:hypothetical protein